MGRRIRTTIPQLSDQLTPLIRILQARWQVQERTRGCHSVQSLPELPNNTPVWVANNSTNEPGMVVSPAETSRSYIVETNNGQVRRNQQHLTPMPTKQHPCVTCSSPVQTRSKTGTVVTPPERLSIH